MRLSMPYWKHRRIQLSIVCWPTGEPGGCAGVRLQNTRPQYFYGCRTFPILAQKQLFWCPRNRWLPYVV